MAASEATDFIGPLTKGWRGYLLIALIALASALPGVGSMGVLDRDEARFAQATRQMIETGDFVRIRLQEDARNKKPIGIHWLQTAAVEATMPITRRDNAIWAYRIPSVLGAVMAALSCLWAGRALMPPRAAFIGAALFAASMLLSVEGLIAKTDGALAGFTTLAMAALAQLYAGTKRPKATALLFWFAMGAGILIKGPVSPLAAGMCLIALAFWERRASWMSPLTFWPGPLLALFMVTPWMIAIGMATHGAFFAEAIGQDMAPKLGGGSEGHLGAPGYHLALLAVTFFPGTFALIGAYRLVWRTDRGAGLLIPAALAPSLLFFLFMGAASALHAPFAKEALKHPPALALAALGALACLGVLARRVVKPKPIDDADKPVRFLAAWFIPIWLLFEFLPTKLPHYVLPAFPAMALLCGLSVETALHDSERWTRRFGNLLFALGAIALIALAAYLAQYMPGDADASFRRAAQTRLVLGGAAIAALAIMMFVRFAGAQVLAAILLALFATYTLRERIAPEARMLLVSAELESALRRDNLLPNDERRLYSIGYGEMSLVFLTRTDIRIRDAETMAVQIRPGDILVVEAREREAVAEALNRRQMLFAHAGQPVVGRNYGNGDTVVLEYGVVEPLPQLN